MELWRKIIIGFLIIFAIVYSIFYWSVFYGDGFSIGYYYIDKDFDINKALPVIVTMDSVHFFGDTIEAKGSFMPWEHDIGHIYPELSVYDSSSPVGHCYDRIKVFKADKFDFMRKGEKVEFTIKMNLNESYDSLSFMLSARTDSDRAKRILMGGTGCHIPDNIYSAGFVPLPD